MKHQLKVGIFAATITVLLISMGNLPSAMGGASPPQATLTLNLFCDLSLASSNVILGAVNPNDVVPFDFSLVNNGNGESTGAITGAAWQTTVPDELIAVGSTTYAVATNSIPATPFTGSPQTLGVFSAGEAAETVDLSVTVTLVAANAGYQGAGTLDMVVTETNCA